MLKNFHLTGIISGETQMKLLQIPMVDKLQCILSEDWHSQYEAFVNDIQEIPFEAGYKPEDHERFCEPNYRLPEWLVKESSLSIFTLDKLTDLNDQQMNRIKGIVAFARNEHDEELMLFQNFRRPQAIKPGRFLIMSNDNYTNIENPGLILGEKLSAVYHSTERKLLFDNFYNVNLFLPLSEYFKPASEQEIRTVLSHEKLDLEDLEILASNPNQWFRTRIALLKRLGFLDQYTVHEIQSRAKDCNLSIQLSANEKKIVFPSDKSAARRLLQFLNEEIFRGSLTRDIYETNSKRKVNS